MLFSRANPIAMWLVFVGWMVTQVGLILRTRADRTRGAAPPKDRDLLSFLFFLIQSAGIVAAFWGAVRIRPHYLDRQGFEEIVIVGALCFLGDILFISAMMILGRNFTLYAQVRDEGKLVTTGPYAIVRNPIYFAYFLVLLATPLAFGHPRSLLVAAPVYLVGAGLRILREERVLRAHFGAEYDSYAAKVKRLIPFIW